MSRNHAVRLIRVDRPRPILGTRAAADLRRRVLARAGSADEVAQVIMFLASPAASYLTGSQFTVDGGVLPVV
jgi:3alpha(or 20beta)-hydroxysteroid dehydrogenase